MNRLIIWTALLAMFAASHAHAGAWTQEEGGFFLALSQSYFESNGFFDVNGSEQDTLRYTKVESRLYAEYGLTDHITLGVNAAYAAVQQQFLTTVFIDSGGGPIPTEIVNGGANRVLVDPEIFLRTKLYQAPGFIVSAEGLFKLPSQVERANGPVAGTEERDAEFALLLGKNFELFGETHFLDTRFSYRWRDVELDDQYSVGAQVGFRVWDDFLIIPGIDFTWAETIPAFTDFTRSGREDFNLIKAELGLIYEVTDSYALTLSAFSHIDGKNVGSGEAVTTGVSYRF